MQFWMILVHLSLYRTRTNNNHPIVDDSSHPFLKLSSDSSHPHLDGVNYHPILDDSTTLSNATVYKHNNYIP